MDWDFSNKENNPDAAYMKGVFEGGQMEHDAIKWITDKVATLIYDEMKAVKSERERAAITAAMPMMAVASIVTFTSVAAKPDPKYRLRAQSLMLKAALDFTEGQLKKVDKMISELPASEKDTEELSMFEAVKVAMDDMYKMPKSEWIKKHGNLIEQMEKNNARKKKKGEG